MFNFEVLSAVLFLLNLIKNVISSSNMTSLSQKLFNNNKFEDIAYAEPMYVKKPYVN